MVILYRSQFKLFVVSFVLLFFFRSSIPLFFTKQLSDRQVDKVDFQQDPSTKNILAKLPAYFEGNSGQFGPDVKFLAQFQDHTLSLTTDAVVWGWQDQSSPTSSQVKMGFFGGNPNVKTIGLGELPNKMNYFIGNDPSHWRCNVPTYAKVKYANVYDGIDLVFHSTQSQLEYDFIVGAGNNPQAIELEFAGAQKVEIAPQGDLLISSGDKQICHHQPFAYQEIDGEKFIVSSSYIKKANGHIGFVVGSYNMNEPLVIDPVLSFSTYLGGTKVDGSSHIATDSAGNLLLAVTTQSSDFPVTNAFNPVAAGKAILIVKLNSSGSAILYSTYITGGGGEQVASIAVDAFDNVYITGTTQSDNFPTTTGAFQTRLAQSNPGPSQDAFVAKLKASGDALLYSTFLGGNRDEIAKAIALDALGNAYITGSTCSPDFPLTTGAFKTSLSGNCDIFVTKLNAQGNGLGYSTFVGGRDSQDTSTDIAIDKDGNAYVTGNTLSSDFPTTPGAYQRQIAMPRDGFVFKLNQTGSSLLYSTFIGGNGNDEPYAIAVDTQGQSYITGTTFSDDFPLKNPFMSKRGADFDGFVSKFNANGTDLIYSTYLGGDKYDLFGDIYVNSSGQAIITGTTLSTNFPVVKAFQSECNCRRDGTDVFVIKLNAEGTTPLFSTYLGGSEDEEAGGITVDAFGSIYVVGTSRSTNFPVVNALQSFNKGDYDIVVFKIGAPRILNAVVDGKRLTITGQDFDDEAIIFVDGQELQTKRDGQTLISKKGGKKIKSGQTVKLQVQNSDGTLSPEFEFTRAVSQVLKEMKAR